MNIDQARDLVKRAEADLGILSRGRITDLLLDNWEYGHDWTNVTVNEEYAQARKFAETIVAERASKFFVTAGEDKAYEIVACTNGSWYVCDTHHRIVASLPSHFAALRHVRTLQGLPTCHDFLVDEGAYIWTHFDEDVEDRGGPESGPMVDVTSAYDQYAGETDIIFFESGKLVHREPRDIAFEVWCEECHCEE